MTGVDLTRIDGVDAYTALKVISEIGTDMTKWPKTLRFLAGAKPEQPGHRRQGHQLKDQAQRQPGCGGIASGRQRAHRSDSALGAFLWERPRTPPPPTSWLGSSTPCCATAKRRGCNTTRDSISSGPCVRPSVGRPNWATNWCPCPTPGTAPRTHLPVRQSPRDNEWGALPGNTSTAVINWESVSTTIAALCPLKRRRLLLCPWRSSGSCTDSRCHPVISSISMVSIATLALDVLEQQLSQQLMLCRWTLSSGNSTHAFASSRSASATISPKSFRRALRSDQSIAP